MPGGRYRIMDGDGTEVGWEEFRCGPGPMGWRYFSNIETSRPEPHTEIVDVAVDSAWRPVRTRIDTGAHQLMLAHVDHSLMGLRDGEALELEWDSDMELDYLSPCFNVVTARRLDASAEIDVLFLEPFTCEPVRERQRYELEGEEEVDTPAGRFGSTRWLFTALRTGWSRNLWVAGDVLVAYQGLYELVEYEAGSTGPAPA